VRKAEAELKAAVEDLKRQEEEYQNKIRTLEKQANDTSGSVVSRGRGEEREGAQKLTFIVRLPKTRQLTSLPN
jgi:hypothetical protein